MIRILINKMANDPYLSACAIPLGVLLGLTIYLVLKWAFSGS